MTDTPTKAQIFRVVNGAMDAGFPIGAVEIAPDGTIRLLRFDTGNVHSATNPADLIDMSAP